MFSTYEFTLEYYIKFIMILIISVKFIKIKRTHFKALLASKQLTTCYLFLCSYI